PIFIIAGLIFYFVKKNKKKRELKSLENQNNIPFPTTETTTLSENLESENQKDSEEPDYSKYLPKN
ncbi:hypothetical protein, partial [Kaistella sp.]|uniref:hypothetical protein n=1 Tax=Kaistella sp. TaxID=2782235 RepID=UPI003C4AEA4B